jgi:hypothetical protein
MPQKGQGNKLRCALNEGHINHVPFRIFTVAFLDITA